MPPPDRAQVYRSGQWEVDLTRCELRARGEAVPIGGRAFEIIAALARSSGKLVLKDDLMRQIWPGAMVGENTLPVHISAIRKALGPDRGMLQTVSGRGYRLQGTWTIRHDDAAPERAAAAAASMTPALAPAWAPALAPAMAPAWAPAQTNVPLATSVLIGRDGAIRHLKDLLSAYRVVTLTGPGGIGKTALALEVIRQVSPGLQEACWFVALASLSDPALVPSAVAAGLGLKLAETEIAAASIARAIGHNRVRLVLDNCEHVMHAAAELAETVVRLCPNAAILATSREILRVDGEQVWRVPALDVPPSGAAETDDCLGHSAVQLFIARATALQSDFAPGRRGLAAIGAICRRLDGIPLAIEFAAARAAVLGPEVVLHRLDDRFALLTSGRRTALPRHQTLRATLDWSYDLLSEPERHLLRRLAVFAASFALEAASAVMSETGSSLSAVAEGIANLATKSLVAIDGPVAGGRWRLLETIRAYAREKLTESGEAEQAMRCHATHHLDLLKAAAQPDTRPGTAVPGPPRSLVDEVSAALEWAFSPRGDRAIGIDLTLGAVPLWTRMSLVQECRRRVEQAITGLHETGEAGGHIELRLLVELATAMQNGAGPGQENTRVWRRANALAMRLGDQDFQLRTLWGLWIDSRNSGEHRQGLEVATRFQAVASLRNDPEDALVADRMVGMSLFILGNLRDAQLHVERMLMHYAENSRASHMIRFHFEQRAGAEFLLALLLWLRGSPHRALALIDDGVAEVAANGHALQLCVLLAQFACPIACMMRDPDRLDLFTSRLSDSAERHGLAAWGARGRCWQALARILRGEIAVGVGALERALRDFPGERRAFQYVWFVGELARAQLDAGNAGAAHRSIKLALERAVAGGEMWCVPELLRINGHVLLSRKRLAEAEAAFNQSLALSRQQEAVAWELRTATSLARLWCELGRLPEAVALLAPIRGRFDDAFETEDMRDAKALLASWS